MIETDELEDIETMDHSVRVHVAALGFEVDKIIEPLLKMDADRFVLVIRKDETYAKKFQDEIERKLDQNGIDYMIKEAELLDLVDCISVFGRIIHKLREEEHDVYVNVSSSTSISAIGASFAATLWGAKPYYARPEYYLHVHERKPGDPLSKGLRDVIPIYNLHFERPDEKLLHILQYIKNKGSRDRCLVKNKDVIEFLNEIGYIEVGDKVKHRDQSLNKKFRERYRNLLEKHWGFIFLEGNTKSKKIGLTDKGKKYLKMFEYLV